jgi:hypothetical protein
MNGRLCSTISLIIVLSGGCFPFERSFAEYGVVEIQKQYRGKVYVPFQIVLPKPSGTGLSWQLHTDTTFFNVSQSHQERMGISPGSSISEYFTIVPKYKGDYTLQWDLGRPGKNPFETILIRIHVD